MPWLPPAPGGSLQWLQETEDKEVTKLKAITPIIDLSFKRVVSLDAVEALEELGVISEDEFTYTMRIDVVPEKIAAVRKQLKDRLDPEDFRVLMEILDETEWDCSFLVDCY